MLCQPGVLTKGVDESAVTACRAELEALFKRLVAKHGQPAAVVALGTLTYITVLEQNGMDPTNTIVREGGKDDNET